MQKILNEFFEGSSADAYKFFGPKLYKTKRGSACRFRVYAPNAAEVSLLTDMNAWEHSKDRFKKIDERGVWEIKVDGLKEWDRYKFDILTQDGRHLQKSDPYAFYSELRPANASIIFDNKAYKWNDAKWMRARRKNFDMPLNIYEVHLGSWRRKWENGDWLDIDMLICQLVPYVRDNGFTHVEFMPITEHPFDGSWGYQATGYYSPTSRYGDPNDFKKLIDSFHQNGIGVILDVVPAHFVKDSHGLAEFDGSKLYEYDKAYDAENEWGTLNFAVSKEEIRSFLVSSFAFWIKEYHFDGLRFDAISHLIYWVGNKNRGINEEAVNFVKRKNHILSSKFPSVMLIAEDSSDFQNVTAPTFEGGLGYDYKWDLGWMNDTLKYFKLDPIYRKAEHNLITFSMYYFYSERFLLPFSHDEVVHMKGSIINKLWGTYEQKFAQARLLMGYMFAHPGKKLNFMGNELASFDEWSENKEVGFHLLSYPVHSSFLRYFRDLSEIYKNHKSMHTAEYSSKAFRWIDADNRDQSVFSFIRESAEELIVTVLNMLPLSYETFKIGVPYEGAYVEILNSEKDIYSGCNMCNYKPIISKAEVCHGFKNSIVIRIAPFSCIYFKYGKTGKK